MEDILQHTFTATELKERAGQALDQAERGLVVITRHNRPVAALVSWEAYQGLLDTFDALIDPRLAENVRIGLNQFYIGKMMSWEEACANLGLPSRPTG